MPPDPPQPTLDQPLDRALLVIEQVLKARGPVSLSEIAEAAQLAPATAHRVVTQLETRLLLKRAIGSKKFLPGSRLVALGAQILEASFVGDRGHAALLLLAQQTHEHCHIGVVSEWEVLYVDSARSAKASGLHFEPGTRAPVYCTSIGKTFLASLPQKALDEFVAMTSLKRFTPNTIHSGAELSREIELVRKRGWASTDEEFTPGVVGCAVPIRHRSGRFIAGVGISVPKARCSLKQVQDFLPALKACARAIEDILSDTA